MKRLGLLNQMAEFLQAQEQEVYFYRQVERDLTGRDLAWDHARHEWLNRHFGAWKRLQWNQAIHQALRLPECALN